MNRDINPVITLSAISLEVVYGNGERDAINWETIERVVAYLKDCFSMDQIRFEFETPQKVLLITENFEGWNELVQKLPEYLPGFPNGDDWFPKVALPPFNKNLTTLFQRNGVQQ